MRRNLKVFIYSDNPSPSLKTEIIVDYLGKLGFSAVNRGKLVDFLSLPEDGLSHLAELLVGTKVNDISAPLDVTGSPGPVETLSEMQRLKGGESYPENIAFCPRHGVKLEHTGGGQEMLKDSTTGMEFVLVEGGCFTMGTRDDDEDSQDREKPSHKVCVDSFYIGRFEVTQDQWKSVMESNPSNFIGGQRPVEQVSWRDAQEFISRLK